ncbi:MAG: ABC transporter substrate-binding protein [Rhizobiales bacterium]|nr:ABC transporter substrate-binding protein [Hyphomicrobiales bacterium]
MAGYSARPIGRRQFIGLLMGGMLGGAISWPSAAIAATDGAKNYVARIADEVMALANSGQTGNGLRSKFLALLKRYIDLRDVANYALGPYRNKLPAGKKNEFYRAFEIYVAGFFAFYVKDFRGSGLQVISSSTQGKFIVIHSALKPSREQVRWRLTNAGSGFRVNDVNVKGAWVRIAMQGRITRILKGSKGDFEALFEELREADSW